jgi:uncharacterized protein
MPYRTILMLLLATFVARPVLAEELTDAKSGDIRHLMEVTGGTVIARQFAAASSQGIFQALKASRPEVPDRALEVMDRELMALFSEKMAAPGGLMDQVIPVYHKYFTHQEIRELLDFYQTPIGKKAIMVLPRVVSDSMVAGRRWGESLGPEIETRVRAALEREGLLPKGM